MQSPTSTALQLDQASRQLLALVSEFLSWAELPLTAQTLADERLAKRRQVASSVGPTHISNATRSKMRADLLRKFDEGKREDFFALWQQYVPAAMLASDLESQKTEFHLSIFFAIFPALPSSAVLVATPGTSSVRAHSARHELAQRMKAFKHFLETRGAPLAGTPEFLAYYALPYVPQPERHPSFEHLFSMPWVEEQRLSLKQYLEAVARTSGAGLEAQPPPALLSLFMSQGFHGNTQQPKSPGPRARTSPMSGPARPPPSPHNGTPKHRMGWGSRPASQQRTPTQEEGGTNAVSNGIRTPFSSSRPLTPSSNCAQTEEQQQGAILLPPAIGRQGSILSQRRATASGGLVDGGGVGGGAGSGAGGAGPVRSSCNGGPLTSASSAALRPSPIDRSTSALGLSPSLRQAVSQERERSTSMQASLPHSSSFSNHFADSGGVNFTSNADSSNDTRPQSSLLLARTMSRGAFPGAEPGKYDDGFGDADDATTASAAVNEDIHGPRHSSYTLGADYHMRASTPSSPFARRSSQGHGISQRDSLGQAVAQATGIPLPGLQRILTTGGPGSSGGSSMAASPSKLPPRSGSVQQPWLAQDGQGPRPPSIGRDGSTSHGAAYRRHSSPMGVDMSRDTLPHPLLSKEAVSHEPLSRGASASRHLDLTLSHDQLAAAYSHPQDTQQQSESGLYGEGSITLTSPIKPKHRSIFRQSAQDLAAGAGAASDDNTPRIGSPNHFSPRASVTDIHDHPAASKLLGRQLSDALLRASSRAAAMAVAAVHASGHASESDSQEGAESGSEEDSSGSEEASSEHEEEGTEDVSSSSSAESEEEASESEQEEEEQEEESDEDNESGAAGDEIGAQATEQVEVTADEHQEAASQSDEHNSDVGGRPSMGGVTAAAAAAAAAVAALAAAVAAAGDTHLAPQEEEQEEASRAAAAGEEASGADAAGAANTTAVVSSNQSESLMVAAAAAGYPASVSKAEQLLGLEPSMFLGDTASYSEFGLDGLEKALMSPDRTRRSQQQHAAVQVSHTRAGASASAAHSTSPPPTGISITAASGPNLTASMRHSDAGLRTQDGAATLQGGHHPSPTDSQLFDAAAHLDTAAGTLDDTDSGYQVVLQDELHPATSPALSPSQQQRHSADGHRLSLEPEHDAQSPMVGRSSTASSFTQVCHSGRGHEVDESSVSLRRMAPAGGTVLKQSVMGLEDSMAGSLLAPLDYACVKRDLLGGDASLCARLLQALRWRLTRSKAGIDRWQVLTSWIEVDLLGCHSPGPHGSILASIAVPPFPSTSKVAAEPAITSELSVHNPGVAATSVSASQQSGINTTEHHHSMGSSGSTTGLTLAATPAPVTGAGAALWLHPPALEELTRLVSAIACDRMGRSYLLQPRAPSIAALVRLLTWRLNDDAAAAVAVHLTGSESIVPGGAGAHPSSRAAAGSSATDPSAPEAGRGSGPSVLHSAHPPMGSAVHGGGTLGFGGAGRHGNSGDGMLRSPAVGLQGMLQQQALVALQKLSVHRGGQGEMVRHGLVPWLVDFLQEERGEQSTEYAMALLMNLSLRNAGKAACGAVVQPLLHACESLVESSNERIRTYVNGTLYSVFALAPVREAARVRGTDELLKAVVASSATSRTFAGQIEHILELLEEHTADDYALGMGLGRLGLSLAHGTHNSCHNTGHHSNGDSAGTLLDAAQPSLSLSRATDQLHPATAAAADSFGGNALDVTLAADALGKNMHRTTDPNGGVGAHAVHGAGGVGIHATNSGGCSAGWSDDEEDEADNCEGEDGETWDQDEAAAFADLDLLAERLVTQPGVAAGEALLCTSYLAGTEEAQAQVAAVRSSLAVTLRASQRFKATSPNVEEPAPLERRPNSRLARLKRGLNPELVPVHRPCTPKQLSGSLHAHPAAEEGEQLVSAHSGSGWAQSDADQAEETPSEAQQPASSAVGRNSQQLQLPSMESGRHASHKLAVLRAVKGAVTDSLQVAAESAAQQLRGKLRIQTPNTADSQSNEPTAHEYLAGFLGRKEIPRTPSSGQRPSR